MQVIKPALPDLDVAKWLGLNERDRTRQMCRAWAMEGFGAPLMAYLFYVVKIAVYVTIWILFVSRSPEIAGWSDIETWWATPLAFEKAILWTMLFEIVGLGCGSGPLTARYVPPVVAFTHFLRPGTIRLPPFPHRVPLTRGDQRSLFDAALYAAVVMLCVRALWSPDELTAAEILAVLAVLATLGLRDKTAFLAARSEHYASMLIVFLLAGDDLEVLIAGAMVVELAIWWGAATSKLNHHFPSVVAVMISNSAILRWRPLRRRLYRDFPDDLRPSSLSQALAHGGTAIEYVFPLILASSGGGRPTAIALAVMFTFHLFITSCFPLGVPLEWNVVFVYSAFVLFGVHAEVSILDVFDNPALVVLIAAGLLIGPVLGNVRPDLISFLPAMRYYAGNWSASLWLFGPGIASQVDATMTKTSPDLRVQLNMLYDEELTETLMGRVRAFRSMHLHGRALNAILNDVVADDLDGYEVLDGEGVAGLALGWNFGDGHLHQEQLLAAIQSRAKLEAGDLRVVVLESQPFHRPWLHWRYVDAADGLVDEGQVLARDLLDHQPWPEPGALDLHAGDAMAMSGDRLAASPRSRQ